MNYGTNWAAIRDQRNSTYHQVIYQSLPCRNKIILNLFDIAPILAVYTGISPHQLPSISEQLSSLVSSVRIHSTLDFETYSLIFRISI